MNTIMVQDCFVLPYSKEKNVPFVMEENENGKKKAMFRILERQYGWQNQQNWFCIARRSLAEQIEKMKLSIGSDVIITGKISVYIDKDGKEGRKLEILSIDFDKTKKKKDDTAELDSALVESVSFA